MKSQMCWWIIYNSSDTIQSSQRVCSMRMRETTNKKFKDFWHQNQLILQSYEINRFCHLNWLSLISQEYKTRTRIQLTRHNNKSLWFTLDGRYCCVVGKIALLLLRTIRETTHIFEFFRSCAIAHMLGERERENYAAWDFLSLSRIFTLFILCLHFFVRVSPANLISLSRARVNFIPIEIQSDSLSLVTIIDTRENDLMCDVNFNFNKMKHKSFSCGCCANHLRRRRMIWFSRWF